MMNDGTFQVEVNGRSEFVQATDQDHANRIAGAMAKREPVKAIFVGWKAPESAKLPQGPARIGSQWWV